MATESMTQKVLRLMHKSEQIRNICTIAHIDHGKTTFSDNLLAGAGMISEDLAGKQCFMDFLEEEQQRGITIQTANISMVHNIEGKEFLVNLLDTPGHVDFGGDVTRALRAVDGAIVLVCAVEGAMPQTETVLRQALKDRVKPILFINKVDRLIKELQLTPEKMQEQFVKIINSVNDIIRSLAPIEYKDKWTVSVQDGSVAFGSAYHNWAMSYGIMKKKGLGFKDVLDAYSQDKVKELAKKAPLHEVLLDIVIKHLPSPTDAQKYRIPKLWAGDAESKTGQQLLNCDPKGQIIMVVTKIVVDPQAGEICCSRIFSGTLKKGANVYLNLAKREERIQQIFLYKGAQRIAIDEAVCGNIVGVGGLKGAACGETISEEPIEPFESIKHIFEPVVTKAIEAKNPQDLPKLIEILKALAKEDPTIVISINEQTGENLISGLGELHLEIKEHIITRDKGLQIVSSPPIVVYRESVRNVAGPVLGKSPNKHNHLFISVEPMPVKLFAGIQSGEIPETKIKKRDKALANKLVEFGMDRNDAYDVKDIYKGNILMDSTKGIVHIQEIMELVMQSFEEVCDAGPLAKEPMARMIVKLMDCKLHEDAIHRGPAQIIPAMRQGILGAMLSGGALLYEPVQTIRIDSPMEYLGAISKLIQGRRGQLLDTSQERGNLVVKAKMPVGEMFGWISALRSATSGHGASFLVDQDFEKLPENLQNDIILRIRKRKGMKAEIPKLEEE